MRRLLSKLAGFTRRSAIERDLDREMAAHLALLADDFERKGMTPEEARNAARFAFGGVDAAKEMSRDARSVVWMEQAWQDLRHASRSLLHNPGFSLMAALTLAVGIGVNVTLFAAYNALVLKPLPVADPDRVFRMERWYKRGALGDIQYAFSYPEYIQWRDRNHAFTGLVAASWPVPAAAILRGVPPFQARGELVSANYFAELGVGAQLGRVFRPEDNLTETPPVVLSDSFWQRRLQRDPSVVGQTILLNGASFVIAAVAREAFTGTSVGLQTPDFWAPLSAQKQLAPAADWLHEPATMRLQVLARLKPSAAIQQAEAEAGAIIRQFDEPQPGIDITTGVTLQRTSFLGNTEDPRFQVAVAGVMLTVGLVLLAACANIANMLLARGVSRQREIAIRLALGAGRRRVIRHLLAESLLLASLGGAFGLVLSLWASKLLWVFVQKTFEGPLTNAMVMRLDVSPDLRVFLYTAAISLSAGVLFGLMPALRSSSADLNTAIKDEGSYPGSRLSRSRLRGVLIAGQMAVSTLLLISAGLLMRGMLRSADAVTGYETHRVVMITADFGSTPAITAAVQRRVLDRLQTTPEVKAAGLGDAPLLGTWTPPVIVEGPRGTIRDRTLASSANETFFGTLGIALQRGRVYTRAEAEQGAKLAVISEAAGRRFWPQEDPLGKRFRLDMNFRGDLTEFEVVGIVNDVRYANLTRPDPAHVYVPATPARPSVLLVHVQGDLHSGEAAVRKAIGTVDQSLLPSVAMMTLEDGPMRLQRSLAAMLAGTGAILAGLTMTLAFTGIYGVMAFFISQRIREIGIRIAMGATAGDVLTTVVAQGLRPVLTGLGLGAFAAAALSWVLHTSLVLPGSSDLFYGVPFYDPVTFLGAALMLTGMAAAASLVPAQRALRVDPMVSLRYQ